MWELVNIYDFEFVWKNNCGKCCIGCKTFCELNCISSENKCLECDIEVKKGE